jgi:hypothetical protein
MLALPHGGAIGEQGEWLPGGEYPLRNQTIRTDGMEFSRAKRTEMEGSGSIFVSRKHSGIV